MLHCWRDHICSTRYSGCRTINAMSMFGGSKQLTRGEANTAHAIVEDSTVDSPNYQNAKSHRVCLIWLAAKIKHRITRIKDVCEWTGLSS